MHTERNEKLEDIVTKSTVDKDPPMRANERKLNDDPRESLSRTLKDDPKRTLENTDAVLPKLNCDASIAYFLYVFPSVCTGTW